MTERSGERPQGKTITIADRDMVTCKHFNGVQHDACKAGIRYESVRVEGFSLPCLPLGAKPMGSCERREYPTREEAEAYERDVMRRIEHSVMARAAIVQHAKHQRGVSGQMPCPICKTGRLNYSIAGLNGHIHAGCSTQDCVCFME